MLLNFLVRESWSLPVQTHDENCKSFQRGDEYGYEQLDSTGVIYKVLIMWRS